MFQWLAIAGAACLSLVALARARRVSQRLERLSESYWELRYEYGQVTAKLARLEGPAADAQGSDAAGAAAAPPRSEGRATFVPLSSLKR